MKKIIVSIVATFGVFFSLFSMSAQAQFNPGNGFNTISNQCGTFFLQNSTYYNYQGVSLGSKLPVCIPPITIQNSSALIYIPAQYTNATLPACSAATNGLVAVETDGASSPVYNATATGSGSVTVTVLCNGTNWTNH